ncbi:aminoacyl-tRNA deacylase [Streptococcus zalophi]|uniref:Cys-tRNA(Pro)/Cys-tRNA(Cys) deacylase n=1 Tax=Streptococcus zalophi TaxID=640031 RepID=A0A934P8X7_9STRE|nr:aminoacyl-tRNA deacylase [Streptococcus zalophi]MBJ8349174.1 aminoacyl-tRNA deacylase [Streptococcus zalophi]MCR8967204.1 aminoacyl-tRNA deacylase [Streptococcus zalophi]
MSKKSKHKKTLVNQILDKANIKYENVFITVKEGKPGSQNNPSEIIFKTLALSGDKTGPIIGIIPVQKHLSEKKLAKISGNKKVKMIPQKELQATTGYVHGANNPIGIRQRHDYPIYIDQLSLSYGDIIVSAGEIGHSIKINSQKLADFVDARFADLIE